MRASDLKCELERLIERHGDLEIVCDCDNILTELRSEIVLDESHGDTPVIVICTVPSDI